MLVATIWISAMFGSAVFLTVVSLGIKYFIENFIEDGFDFDEEDFEYSNRIDFDKKLI